MRFLKELKINTLITAIVYVVLGLLFILLPEAVSKSIAIILGLMMTLLGLAYIIDYFRKWDIEYKSNGLAIGILLIFGALFLLFQGEIIVTIIPLILGFAVVVSGTVKLQNAIVLNRAKESIWLSVLVLAIISLALGFIIMINPFVAFTALIVFIGIGLLVCGVTDLVIIFLMSRRSKELKAAGHGGLSDSIDSIIDTKNVLRPKEAVKEALSGFGVKVDEKEGKDKE